MCWRAGDPWAPLNCQDPLFRLTSLHPRQTGGSIGGVLPLCRTAAGEFYPPSGWGVKYPDDFSKSKGLNQLWYKDTTDTAVLADNVGFKIRHDYIITNSQPRGSFSFRIPLKHVFGFCGDYDKVVYRLKHNLTLTRNDDNEAIYRGANNAAGNPLVAGKIVLSKISWFMPHVTPADKDKMELYKIIERKEKIPVGYRMIQRDNASIPQSTSFSWRLSVKSSPEIPRFIIVGFQTGKSGDQEQNPSIFDNVNVKNIYVTLNSEKYPSADYSISFLSQKFSRVYGDVAEFRAKFLTWMSWYRAQTLPPQIIEPYILYFCSMFPNKAKN